MPGRGDIPEVLDALDSCTDLFGSNNARTLAVAHQLALAIWDAGDADQAVSLLNHTLDCITERPDLESGSGPRA
jgi:hypothetical protein